jgi:hypothetical protein
MHAFTRSTPRGWLAKLRSAGRRALCWWPGWRAPQPRPPTLAPALLATPAPTTRRTVIVSCEHFPGEPFAVTRRRFKGAGRDELELTIEGEPAAPRHRRRGQYRRIGGLTPWSP